MKGHIAGDARRYASNTSASTRHSVTRRRLGVGGIWVSTEQAADGHMNEQSALFRRQMHVCLTFDVGSCVTSCSAVWRAPAFLVIDARRRRRLLST